jgi:hypothetical protein
LQGTDEKARSDLEAALQFFGVIKRPTAAKSTPPGKA